MPLTPTPKAFYLDMSDDRLSNLMAEFIRHDYNVLSHRCDKVLEKIKKRKLREQNGR